MASIHFLEHRRNRADWHQISRFAKASNGRLMRKAIRRAKIRHANTLDSLTTSTHQRPEDRLDFRRSQRSLIDPINHRPDLLLVLIAEHDLGRRLHALHLLQIERSSLVQQPNELLIKLRQLNFGRNGSCRSNCRSAGAGFGRAGTVAAGDFFATAVSPQAHWGA
jgi:hypothetical protein